MSKVFFVRECQGKNTWVLGATNDHFHSPIKALPFLFPLNACMCACMGAQTHTHPGSVEKRQLFLLWSLATCDGKAALSLYKGLLAFGHEFSCSRSCHVGAPGTALPWKTPILESIPSERFQGSHNTLPNCSFSPACSINVLHQKAFAPVRWRVSQSWVQILALPLTGCMNLDKSSVRR